MNMDDAFRAFIEESRELLLNMEDQLIDLDTNPADEDAINSVFRAAHTIKGSAGLFGLEAIVEFTHVVENVLDKVRAKTVRLSAELISLLLSGVDYIGKLLDSIQEQEIKLENDEASLGKTLSDQLMAHINNQSNENNSLVISEVGEEYDNSDEHNNVEIISQNEAFGNENWHISVKFGLDVLRFGLDPIGILRYLSTIGDVKGVLTVVDNVPPISELDVVSCYIGLEIIFYSSASKKEIESAFEFIQEDCQLTIIPPRAKIENFIGIIDNLSDEELRLGELLIECGTLTERELEEILDYQNKDKEKSRGSRLIGELIVDDKLAQPEVVEAALNKQAKGRKISDQQNRSVRVDSDKLDALINLIGELVIAGAGIETEMRNNAALSSQESSEILVRLIEEVRDSALNLRMVQIGETFQRFHRVVRDVSKELDKSIELVISGGETELDKSVVEKISDPLMHLVRNAIDHGIETQIIRKNREKSSDGKISLNAYHESGTIVIEVKDDGGGLDKNKIVQKAIDNKLIVTASELSDQDIYRLIFEPGFSTASKVSNISGRGVGMDVVRRNIEALRGTIEIDSIYELGTTIRIRLPLTLAIIDGFMMGVGSSAYIVPLDIVEECIELTNSSTKIGQNYINLRGEILPYVRLREHFNDKAGSNSRENVVVVKYGNQKAGFVVDSLMGEYQTVIKPLGALFENLKGISGSTILGSGDVALILDTPELIQQAVRKAAQNTNMDHVD